MKDIRPDDWQLICELEQFARSHTANGEPRTADLFNRAATRMRELCKPPESWLQPTLETVPAPEQDTAAASNMTL